MKDLKNSIISLAKHYRVSLIGFSLLPAEIYTTGDRFLSAVSIAYELDSKIVNNAKNDEASLYNHIKDIHCHAEQLVEHTWSMIQLRGFRVYKTPVSKNLKGMQSHFPHKTAAVFAGLGWIGKSSLLITYEYGPRVWLATILTDAPLLKSEPPAPGILESKCGECEICVRECPFGAIKGVIWQPGMDRDLLIDVFKCAENRRKRGMKQYGRTDECGICLAVCPFARQPYTGVFKKKYIILQQ